MYYHIFEVIIKLRTKYAKNMYLCCAFLKSLKGLNISKFIRSRETSFTVKRRERERETKREIETNLVILVSFYYMPKDFMSYIMLTLLSTMGVSYHTQFTALIGIHSTYLYVCTYVYIL